MAAPKPVPVADKAIANAALTEMFLTFSDPEGEPTGPAMAVVIAEELVTRASKIRFQPSTRQLVLTYDLSFGGDASEPE